ncbi:MAG: GAF domain-containing protein, partial [Pirellulaceae bacterium]|nr:GAF domain-containing protein [Pirellulaceae bacterium]
SPADTAAAGTSGVDQSAGTGSLHRPGAERTPAELGGGSAAATLALLREFNAEWQMLAQEAQRHAEQSLRFLLARLTERFGATSGWLFFLEDGGQLRARVTHLSRQRGFSLPLDGTGIVPHVARTARAYLANDVNDPEHHAVYLGVNDDTRSELAVPVFDADRNLVGVLNLECRLADRFIEQQVGDLTLAASCLVPHMLVLRNVDRCPYHPERHGWDLSVILNRLCHAVTRGLDQALGTVAADTTSCTVWYCDQPKRELFVFATSGFDVEYIADNTLPEDSFTGRVALEKIGTVVHTTPLRAERFRRLDKVRLTGMQRILATPIPVDHSVPARSVLSIYFLSERPDETLPATQAVSAVAALVGSLVREYRVARRCLAKAVLRHRLLELDSPAATGCEVIKDVLQVLFEASGCSVFARGVAEGRPRRVYCVATSGIDAAPAVRGYSAHNPLGVASYDLDADPGYTSYLANHPGTVVRKNDVVCKSERGVPDDLPPLPLNKYRERFALSELDRRRFLGLGVTLDATGAGLLGVVRLNRASSAKPFTRCDEELLGALAELEECKRAFLDAQALISREVELAEGDEGRMATTGAGQGPPVAVYGSQFPSGHAAANHQVVPAVASLMRPVSDLGTDFAKADEIVQSLLVLLQDYAIEHAGVLTWSADRISEPRWYVWRHAESRRACLPEPWEAQAGRRPRRRAGGKILTYDYRQCQPRVRRAVQHTLAAGVRIPVVAWTGRQTIRGTLALDFREPVTWTQNEFVLLFHAARRLSAILSKTDDYVIHPAAFTLHPALAVASLVALTREHEGIRAAGAELRFREHGHLHPAVQLGQPVPDSPGPWPLVSGTGIAAEARGYGVRQRDLAWSIPLRLGSFDVGDLRCSLEPAPDVQQRRDVLLGIVPALWSRLACELQQHILQDFQLTPRPAAAGVTKWSENLSLVPINAAQLREGIDTRQFFQNLRGGS